jgi:hypothetical protein
MWGGDSAMSRMREGQPGVLLVNRGLRSGTLGHSAGSLRGLVREITQVPHRQPLVPETHLRSLPGWICRPKRHGEKKAAPAIPWSSRRERKILYPLFMSIL